MREALEVSDSEGVLCMCSCPSLLCFIWVQGERGSGAGLLLNNLSIIRGLQLMFDSFDVINIVHQAYTAPVMDTKVCRSTVHGKSESP